MSIDLIGNINRKLDQIKNYIRGVGISLQNSFNILNDVRDLLNTIQITL